MPTKATLWTTLILLLFLSANPILGQNDENSKDKETSGQKTLSQETLNTETNLMKSAGTEQQVQAKGSSLFDTVKQGGLVMIPIFILALFALIIIIERGKFFLISRVWNRSVLESYIEEQLSKNKNLKFREEIEEELTGSVQIYINRMEKGLGLLNGIGSLAPILGFFGTVVGMIEAFAAIAAATTVNAKVVAVGIQVALVTTAGGLAVAVPTLFFYHFFMHLVVKSGHEAESLIDKKIKGYPRLLSHRSTSENL